MNFFRFKKKIYILFFLSVLFSLFAVVLSPFDSYEINSKSFSYLDNEETSTFNSMFDIGLANSPLLLYSDAYKNSISEEDFELAFSTFVEDNFEQYGLEEAPDFEGVVDYFTTINDRYGFNLNQNDVVDDNNIGSTNEYDKLSSYDFSQLGLVTTNHLQSLINDNPTQEQLKTSFNKPDDITEALERNSIKQFAKDIGLKIVKISYDVGTTIAKYSGYIILFSRLFDVAVQLFDFLLASFPILITGPYGATGVISNTGISLEFIMYLALSLFLIGLLFNEFISRIRQQRNEQKREQYMRIFVGVLAALFIVQITEVLVIAYDYLTKGIIQVINNQLAITGITGISSFFEYALLQVSYIGPDADRTKVILDVINNGSIGDIYEVNTRSDNLIANTLGPTLVYTLATFDYIYSILWGAISSGASILGAFFALIGSAALLPAFIAISAISLIVGVSLNDIGSALNGSSFLFNPLSLTIGLIFSTLVMMRIAVNLIKFIFELCLIYIFLPITAFSFVYSDGKIFVSLIKRFIGILLTIVLMLLIMLVGLSIATILPFLLVSFGIMQGSLTFNLIVYIFVLLLISNTANVSEKLVGMLGLDGGIQEHQTMLSNPFLWMSIFSRR